MGDVRVDALGALRLLPFDPFTEGVNRIIEDDRLARFSVVGQRSETGDERNWSEFVDAKNGRRHGFKNSAVCAVNTEGFCSLTNVALVELFGDRGKRRVDRCPHGIHNAHNRWSGCIVLEFPLSTVWSAVLACVEEFRLIFFELRSIDEFVEAVARLEPGDERKNLVCRTRLEAARTAVRPVGGEVDSCGVNPTALLRVVEDLVLCHGEDSAGTHFHRHCCGTQLRGLNVVRDRPRLILSGHLQGVVHCRVELVTAEVPVRQTLLGGLTECLEIGDVLDDVVAEPSRVDVSGNTPTERSRERDEVLVNRCVNCLGEL
ncbi:unannotated protein [freshwater metagenome]|uniref:Unannotated protein n=1 Tax=freshwater metagenome TaxID=449393 RepID=A0A6J6G0V9_9ZZZZ